MKVRIAIREDKKPSFVSKGGHNKDVKENSAFSSYFTPQNLSNLARGLHLSASILCLGKGYTSSPSIKWDNAYKLGHLMQM